MRSLILGFALFCLSLSAQSIPFPGPGMAPSGGASPISRIAASTAVAGSTSITTGSFNSTGANTIAVYVGWWFADPVGATVTDSKSNTYARCGATSNDGSNTYEGTWFIAKNATVGSGHTVTVAGNAFMATQATAYSNANTSAPCDQHNESGTTSTVTSIQTGALTPSANNSLVLQGITALDGGGGGEASATINQSFSIIARVGSTGGLPAIITADLIQTSAASVQPTWSNLASNSGMATNSISIKQ